MSNFQADFPGATIIIVPPGGTFPQMQQLMPQMSQAIMNTPMLQMASQVQPQIHVVQVPGQVQMPQPQFQPTFQNAMMSPFQSQFHPWMLPYWPR